MLSGIQTFLSEAGEAACYALDIIELAERYAHKDFDVTKTLQDAVAAKFIYYDYERPNDDQNFFVRDPAGLLSSLTGRKWTVAKVEPTYSIKPGELCVQRWERKMTGKTIGHFRLPDWDSLSDSQTVAHGAIASLRIFSPME